MDLRSYITPISGLSYFLVCKDYGGRLGIEAIGTPEMTRRQIVEDVRDHLTSGRTIVHVKLINGNDMQDVTAEIIAEAVAYPFDPEPIDHQVIRFDHARDLRKHEVV